MIVLGIDVGTTGTKTLALDENGAVLGRGYMEYELITHAGGIVEQSAEDWYKAVVESVRQAAAELDKSDITALSLSTQGDSMLAVDRDFNPLCNVITWMDLRSKAESDYLNEKLGTVRIYKKTGYKIGPSIDAPKIIWIRSHMPEITDKTYNYICNSSGIYLVFNNITYDYFS